MMQYAMTVQAATIEDGAIGSEYDLTELSDRRPRGEDVLALRDEVVRTFRELFGDSDPETVTVRVHPWHDMAEEQVVHEGIPEGAVERILLEPLAIIAGKAPAPNMLLAADRADCALAEWRGYLRSNPVGGEGLRSA